MGCKISSGSSASSQEQEQEDGTSSENSTLLSNGIANGNGYGIERLTDSPSPEIERRPVDLEGGSNYAAADTPDQHTTYPIQTDVSRYGQKRQNKRIRTEELRSSNGSSASEGSLSRQLVRPPKHVVVRDAGRQWGRYTEQQLQQQQSGYTSNTQPYISQINNQNALKLGGTVDADGVIRLPQSSTNIHGHGSAKTQRGKELMEELSKAYRWREQFDHPSPEFLALMDRLYMECQLHLTTLSSRGDLESRREADIIVSEMVALRNYWGPQLLPSSTCNAFVRERIPLTLGADQRQFRIDCAQFFEPVPFYGNQQNSCPGELMKLYRFSVYNVAKNEVVLRYYLERSNVIQLYHVLCFTCENYRGQVRPYGTESPSYWEVRQTMLEDVYSRLLSGLSPVHYQPPKPQNPVIFPTNIMGRPAHLQVMPVANTT